MPRSTSCRCLCWQCSFRFCTARSVCGPGSCSSPLVAGRYRDGGRDGGASHKHGPTLLGITCIGHCRDQPAARNGIYSHEFFGRYDRVRPGATSPGVKEHTRLACKPSEVEAWLARAELDWSDLHAGRPSDFVATQAECLRYLPLRISVKQRHWREIMDSNSKNKQRYPSHRLQRATAWVQSINEAASPVSG